MSARETVICPVCSIHFTRWIADGIRGFCQACSRSCGHKMAHEKRALQKITNFWSGVSGKNNADQCWFWERSTNKCGYGTFGFMGKPWLAHRFAYTVAKADIPEGMCVCHSCDNPPCCNPAHLWLGTPLQNTQDAGAKLRLRKAAGEASGTAKLTEQDVLSIRRRFAAGDKRSVIAVDLNMSWAAIDCIARRVTWRHLEDARESAKLAERVATEGLKKGHVI